MPHRYEGGVVPLPIGGGDEGSLLAIVRRLSRARSEDDIMAVTGHAVRALLQADGATFVLRDGERCYYAAEDAISPLWRGRRFPLQDCVSGWVMLHGKAVAIPDIYQDARVPADAYRPTFVRSLAMAPVGHDEPIAALGAYWAQVRQPTVREVELLQAIADAAALAVANLRLRQAPASERRAPREPTARSDAAPARPSPARFLHRLRGGELRPNSLEAYAFVALAVAAATLVREAFRLSGADRLAVFATYYPVVMVAALVAGRRAGALATVLGGLAAYYFFMPPLYRFVPLDISDLLNLLLFGGASALIILIIDGYKRAVARLRQEDAKHLTLAREQRHRVKNAVSVVEAIVRQSLREAPQQARMINRRIRAGLAGVDLVDGGGAASIRLRDLLAAELGPFDLNRFALEGELDGVAPRDAASLLGLALHELATNALKYGALSVPEGRVTITCRLAGARLAVGWREGGGPLVRPPQRRGYGSVMLRRLIEAAGGAITVDYAPAGVAADISLALESVRAG